MNIADVELLSNMIRYTVGKYPYVQVKEIRLLQEVGGDKRLEVALDVETTDGYHELDVATTIDRRILRGNSSGIISHFPLVAEAVKEKVSELPYVSCPDESAGYPQ